ncbi:MAG TPA: hypothetical protein VFE78_10550, partial [Gemmataceae bacterium]|nr:hypothetical protein [Gemmataceae bacterium]
FEITDYQLGPAARQSSIDLRLKGRLFGFPAIGIHRLEGDRLFLCIFCGEGEKRPTEFATKPLDDRFLFVLRRKK